MVYYLVGEPDLFEKMGSKKDLLEDDMNVCFNPSAGHGLNHENSDEINKMMIDIIEGKILKELLGSIKKDYYYKTIVLFDIYLCFNLLAIF